MSILTVSSAKIFWVDPPIPTERARAHGGDQHETGGKTFEAEMFVRTSLVAQGPADTAAMLQSPTAAHDMARFSARISKRFYCRARADFNTTRFPVRADVFAASRISVAIALLSSEDRPVDFISPLATA
jgi:hypothetical protein